MCHFYVRYDHGWHAHNEDALDVFVLGYGIFRSTDGSVYQGLYYNNKRHGHGCISYG